MHKASTKIEKRKKVYAIAWSTRKAGFPPALRPENAMVLPLIPRVSGSPMKWALENLHSIRFGIDT